MEIFTIQLSRWRQARNRGIAMFDTTVKSGNRIFSPTWDMVLSLKAGYAGRDGIDEETYRKLYHAKMNKSWKEHRGEWLALIEGNEPMAVACYCKSDHYWGCFCHRYLLVDIFEKLCKARNLPFNYYGELT